MFFGCFFFWAKKCVLQRAWGKWKERMLHAGQDIKGAMRKGGGFRGEAGQDLEWETLQSSVKLAPKVEGKSPPCSHGDPLPPQIVLSICFIYWAFILTKGSSGAKNKSENHISGGNLSRQTDRLGNCCWNEHGKPQSWKQ